MIERTKQSPRPSGMLYQTIVGCGLALLLGIASLRFSPVLILGILAACFFAYATVKRPEIALLGILVVTSSILFEDMVPLVPIGGASLAAHDLILLGLLGLIAVRSLTEPKFKVVRTPLDVPMLLFYGVTLLATLIAISQSSVEIVAARRATRVLSYYLVFFAVTNLVRERRQLNLLLNGFFYLATVVAAAMSAQFLFGDSVKLLPGRVETLGTQGTVYEGITRILPPGWSIILVSFVTIVCILTMQEFSPVTWLRTLQLSLMGMALLVTFLRSYWAVIAIVFVLLTYLLRGTDRQRLIRGMLAVIFLAVVILIPLMGDSGSPAAKLASASADRFSTLSNIGTFQGQDSSLNWRIIENRYALSTITSHPLLGLGMGFTYRPWDSRLDPPDAKLFYSYDFRKHIHNGHFWILLQSGFLGYLAFAWLSLAFLIRGFRYWRLVADDQMRAVVLGFTLVYLAVLIAAAVNSTFMQGAWTSVIGIIFGVNEVILLRFRRMDLPAQPSKRDRQGVLATM